METILEALPRAYLGETLAPGPLWSRKKKILSLRKTYLTKLVAFTIYYHPHVLLRTIVYDR